MPDILEPYFACFCLCLCQQRRIQQLLRLERRYDEQYGKIEEIETLIAEVQEQIQTIRREQISGDNIYQLLLAFDEIYESANEVEGKIR